jgi:hypothetical protein
MAVPIDDEREIGRRKALDLLQNRSVPFPT